MTFSKQMLEIAHLPSRIVKSVKINYLYRLYLKKRIRYIEVYRERMNKQIKLGPTESRWRPKTSRWKRIGHLQFQFLVQQRLKPEHSLLDIGCGTLRGGIHFIKYLNPGNYTGIDISPEAIKIAQQLIIKEDLGDRKPRLLITADSQFKEFSGETFDFLFAYSVFCHLPPEEIEEIFQNIGKIMGSESTFFFTFKPAKKFKMDKGKGIKFNFRYPLSYFEELAMKYGFNIRLLEPPSAYNYPEKKRVAKITKNNQITDPNSRGNDIPAPKLHSEREQK